MVTRVGYFCTAGHTEAGGIRQFLEKIHPDIVWLRRFPAYDKPAPKLGRTLPAPRSTDEGCTGDKLVDKMLERIALYYQGAACDFDIALLIDDADCRFQAPGADVSQ